MLQFQHSVCCHLTDTHNHSMNPIVTLQDNNEKYSQEYSTQCFIQHYFYIWPQSRWSSGEDEHQKKKPRYNPIKQVQDAVGMFLIHRNKQVAMEM